MPSFNNYTFTDIQYTIPEGENVSILYPTAQITIVPNSGYTAVAVDFSLDSSFSDNAVQSVVLVMPLIIYILIKALMVIHYGLIKFQLKKYM